MRRSPPSTMLAFLLDPFYEAARQRSVTVAAKVPGVSPPTVTAHILSKRARD